MIQFLLLVLGFWLFGWCVALVIGDIRGEIADRLDEIDGGHNTDNDDYFGGS